MNRLATALPFTLCLVLICSQATMLESAEPFTPSEPEPLTELWRWTQIDALRKEFHECGAVDQDGNPWLAHPQGAVFYDGKKAIDYRFTQEWPLSRKSKDLHVGRDGRIYQLHDEALATLGEDREWRMLLNADEKGRPRSAIAETADGSIWVGLNRGLYKIRANEAKPVPSAFSSLASLIADDRNQLWCIGNSPLELGVYAVDPQSGDLSLLRRESLGDFPEDSDVQLFKRPTGEIWALVAHYKNYYAVDLEDGVETREIPLPPEFQKESFVHHFTSLSDGCFIFFQLPIMGIYRDGEWTILRSGNYPLPADGARVIELLDDRILIAGWQSRSFIVDLSKKHWTTYQDLIFGDDDPSGRSWFMHRDKRVIAHDPSTGTWTAYSHLDGVIDAPNSIYCDDEGIVWVSGAHQERAAVSYLRNGRWERQVFPKTGKTFSHLSACQLPDGSMVFGNGTKNNLENFDGGIVQYKRNPKGFEASAVIPPRSTVSPGVLAAHPDYGLIFGDKIVHSKNPPNAPKYTDSIAFPRKWIDHLTVDHRSHLWVARWGLGLFRFDGEGWKQFTVKDGIAGLDTVYVLNGKTLKGLWAATQQGLSRFDGTAWTQHALDESFVFSQYSGALAETQMGELWMNFSNRHWLLNTFQDISQGIDSDHYCIRYSADDQAPETRLIRFEDRLNEPASAIFSWAGQDPWNNTEEDKLEYSYRLSGGAWSPYRSSTETYFLDLSAGNYSFQVRARDRDWNVDPTPATVSFSVIAPLWKRPWYIALVAATVISIVALIVTIVRQRMKHIIELRDFRIDFFTNLSHELRTPLTVILGPLERMVARADYLMDKSTLDMLVRNASKMLRLVNQLLEFRKLELGKLEYSPSQGELVSFVKDAIHSLTPLWEKKRQTVEITTNRQSYRCGFDSDKLVRIIDNLLSNAIKYTPKKGTISIDLRIEESKETDTPRVHLAIKDNGVGIPPEKLSQVMDPFYRVPSNIKEEAGSGIGLSLVRELVELWGGTIAMQSPVPGEKNGTQVTLTLPLDEVRGKSEDIRSDETIVQPHRQTAKLTLAAIAEEQDEPQESANESRQTDRPSILLVEDNDDLRAYLTSELSEKYQVSAASNGKEGLDTAIENPPDLILSDVMMPEMDGIEFCRKIRENGEICHIPVILLTARSAEEHYIEGIDNGADEYFTKPIKTPKLIVRIESLLKSRRQLYDLFAKQIEIEPKKIAVVSADQKFLEKAIKLVEDNMQTESFDVETFAREMAMTSRTLQRKIKAITGLPPSEFMRSMRLKRAAQLIASSDLSISEIMTYCGIYESSSFSRAFKKEFGLSPTDYRENNQMKVER
ncbi:MAG: ATP-binding protein [Verrucomicrobiota bacterium]